MRQQFSSRELYGIRNLVPLRELIEKLLEIPCKDVEGIFRFLCPKCGEFQTAINPGTNLSRCFRCAINFNSIEIVMVDKQVSFVESVKFLKRHFGKVLAESAPAQSDSAISN